MIYLHKASRKININALYLVLPWILNQAFYQIFLPVGFPALKVKVEFPQVMASHSYV